jgi:iron complex outermembrane receptor protein
LPDLGELLFVDRHQYRRADDWRVMMNFPKSFHRACKPVLVTLLAAGACPLVWAQVTDAIVITGSLAERASADAPYAIGSIDREALRVAGPQVNLSEALVRVPGLVVNNRSNYAQDLQISSRGFGARAGFGVRGVRLYTDGIPASGPDGQGQVSHFDLAGAERVEVLRGPYSVLYGNSSGGVISLLSAPVRRNEVEGELDIGSFGLRQLRVGGAALLGGGFSLKAGASHLELDGVRPQSEARRDLATLRLDWQEDNDRVAVLLNHLDQPAQDPLGLSREQFGADPRQTTAQALQFDTRKSARQSQAGASWRHRFGDGALRDLQLSVYGGQRAVTQFLAIAPATQSNARHGGGVVDFDRDYQGAEARLRLAFGPVDLQLGAAVDRQHDERRGFENFTGSGATQVLGVFGRLRRDEGNDARSADIFGQGEWTIGPALVASAGVRSGRVRLSADDRYRSNGDDSGRLDFSYTNPVAGLRWTPAGGLNLHASVARGHESPTLGEVAYRPAGGGGLNADVKAQTSHQAELGAKWRTGTVGVDLALFETRVDDEIGVSTNAGGRSTFQNVGRTLRRGAELAARWTPASGWRTALAATWLDATYRDAFLTCAGIPCNAPTVTVPAGNRVAGTQRLSGFAELAWRGAAWGEWALELRAVGRTAVNDVNSDFAPGYALLGLRWSKSYALGSRHTLELLARLDNAFDRVHVGSVIVGDANGRFFEPGAPRNALLAVRLVGF